MPGSASEPTVSDVSEPSVSDVSGPSGSDGGDGAALDELRERIDAVDREILDALNRRAGLVLAVGEVKKRSGGAVFRPARERDLIAALAERNPGPFPRSAIRPVFREIISATRGLEAPLRVAFLGPEGTFSHLAARQAFGTQTDFVPVASLPDVLAAVERGETEHGVVPIENTTEGVVTQTLDALLDCELPICGEVLLPISHDLMSATGRLAEVTKVASHPQPLAQCRGWLDRHLPGVERVEVSSTAAAAKLARTQPGVAAIGASLLGENEGLLTLAPAIQDRRDNTTRFLIVGGEEPPPSGNDLTLLAFTVRKGESGALYGLLESFANRGVNLTSIQARPLRGRPWEYVFFLDAVGHQTDPEVRGAFEDAARRSNSHRVLGSFPRAEAPSPKDAIS